MEKVEAGSNAEKCGFRKGDCLVAVNNIPVRNERQASRLLTGTAGDLLVLVEREMEHSDRGCFFLGDWKHKHVYVPRTNSIHC